VEDVARAHGAEVDFVDIGGTPELEARFRELIPVVEIDGQLAFTYFVDAEALDQRLRAVPPASTKRP
jgi:hypothetical protein